jgi:hypothetical protein
MLNNAKVEIDFGSTTYMMFISVATLAFDLRPKQGLAKVRSKCEARESHFMLLGVGE